VLLRSVRHNGDLIVRALQDEGLPVVVVGMANLFDTAEALAAAGIFHYMAQVISEDDLKDLWRDADVGVDERDLATAVNQLTESHRFQAGQRFGIYNLQRTFMTFLETIGFREEKIPGSRGEIVFYNLGKFSQVISDFERFYFQSEPKRKYDAFSRFLKRNAELLPGGLARCRLRQARCRPGDDRPSGEGNGVAGRFRPLHAEESIPGAEDGRERQMACDPTGGHPERRRI
jgi:DNA helicase-2/ATP-dependent DNA helicase PcrA